MYGLHCIPVKFPPVFLLWCIWGNTMRYTGTGVGVVLVRLKYVGISPSLQFTEIAADFPDLLIDHWLPSFMWLISPSLHHREKKNFANTVFTENVQDIPSENMVFPNVFALFSYLVLVQDHHCHRWWCISCHWLFWVISWAIKSTWKKYFVPGATITAGGGRVWVGSCVRLAKSISLPLKAVHTVVVAWRD